MFGNLLHHLVHALTVLALSHVLCTGGRELSDVGPGTESGTYIHSVVRNETLRLFEGVGNALSTFPLERKDVPERSVVAIGLASINRDWRPYVVLGVGEFFGYIVRSITGTSILTVPAYTPATASDTPQHMGFPASDPSPALASARHARTQMMSTDYLHRFAVCFFIHHFNGSCPGRRRAYLGHILRHCTGINHPSIPYACRLWLSHCHCRCVDSLSDMWPGCW